MEIIICIPFLLKKKTVFILSADWDLCVQIITLDSLGDSVQDSHPEVHRFKAVCGSRFFLSFCRAVFEITFVMAKVSQPQNCELMLDPFPASNDAVWRKELHFFSTRWYRH